MRGGGSGHDGGERNGVIGSGRHRGIAFQFDVDRLWSERMGAGIRRSWGRAGRRRIAARPSSRIRRRRRWWDSGYTLDCRRRSSRVVSRDWVLKRAPFSRKASWTWGGKKENRPGRPRRKRESEGLRTHCGFWTWTAPLCGSACAYPCWG